MTQTQTQTKRLHVVIVCDKNDGILIYEVRLRPDQLPITRKKLAKKVVKERLKSAGLQGSTEAKAHMLSTIEDMLLLGAGDVITPLYDSILP